MINYINKNYGTNINMDDDLLQSLIKKDVDNGNNKNYKM